MCLQRDDKRRDREGAAHWKKGREADTETKMDKLKIRWAEDFMQFKCVQNNEFIQKGYIKYPRQLKPKLIFQNKQKSNNNRQP